MSPAVWFYLGVLVGVVVTLLLWLAHLVWTAPLAIDEEDRNEKR